MKIFIDTDTEEFATMEMKEIRVKKENVMLFLQEMTNIYKKLEGRK